MEAAFHLRWLLRRWVWFVAVGGLTVAIGLGAIRHLPERHRAEARLLIDTAQPADAGPQVSAADHFLTVQQRVLTQANLARLADRLGLATGDSGITGAVHVTVTGGTATGARNPAQAITATIGFDGTDAASAVAGSNAVAALLVDEDRAMIRDATARRTASLRADTARLERALADAASAIIAFRQGHRDALPDSLAFRQNRQLAIEAQVARLEQDHATLRDQREQMVRINAGIRLASGAIPTGGVTAAPTDAYDFQLSQIDRRLAAMSVQITDSRATVAALDRSIRQTPVNALMLDRLERNLAALQDEYAQAIAAEARSGAGQPPEPRLHLTEPASAERVTQSPDPQLMHGLVLGGGLVAGFAALALLAVTRRTVDRPADLSAALGIAPFAALPYLPAPAAAWRGPAVAGIIALGAIAAVLALHRAQPSLALPLETPAAPIGQKPG